MSRHWAFIFVFAISLFGVGGLLFVAALRAASLESDTWDFLMLGALVSTLVFGALSLDDLTRIVTREGARPLATPP